MIEKLGPLAQKQQLTILDCFTNGKGDKAHVFNKFYEKDEAQWPYQVIKVTRPELPQAVSDAIYGLHKTLSGNLKKNCLLIFSNTKVKKPAIYYPDKIDMICQE